MSDNLKTTLHRYNFNVSDPTQAKEYKALCGRLKASGVRFFNVLNVLSMPGDSKGPEGPEAGPIELETAHLFADQWSSACGFRVFDWYEGIVPNKDIKKGHWLEQTPDMEETRRNTHVCGFCGNQQSAAKGYVFCDRCLDSSYLKETELHLTRMLSTALFMPIREPLTDAERDNLLPQYIERQTTGTTSRNAAKLRKQRKAIEDKKTKAIETATDEHSGLLWLMDHGISVDNVIYYSHTQRFCFGWRSPIGPELHSHLLAVLVEFPHDYDIKTTD